MVDFLKKVTKHAEGFAPQEQLRVAGVIQPDGATTRQAVAGGVGGLVGVGVNAALEKRRQSKKSEDPAAQPWGMAAGFLQRKMFMTITDQRVVFHAFGEGLGRPKELLGAYPRQSIRGFEITPGKIVHKMRLHFADGSSVDLDLLKGGGDPQRFNAALQG